MTNPSFFSVIVLEFRKKNVFLLSFFITILYLLFALSIPNIRILSSTLFGRYLLSYKLSLTLTVLWGDFMQLAAIDKTLLLLTALLVGSNIALFLNALKRLRKQGNVSLSVGSGTILGLVVTGCSSCGFSLLSLFGVTLSFSFLPFGDQLIRSLSILILLGSIFYIVKKLREEVYCKMPAKQTSSRRK